MDNLIKIVKIALTILGTGITYLIGDFDTALYVLVLFMILDYITGLLIAIIEKKVSSAIGMRGLAKKVFILLLVAVGVALDRLLQSDGYFFRTIVCMFYTANEGISILENASILGLPVPQKIKNILVQIKTENDNENLPE